MHAPARRSSTALALNPGYGYGRAVLGASAGNLAGGFVGQLVASVVAPRPPEVTADVPDEAWDAHMEAVYRSEIAWARLTTALGTVGASVGAALGARPEDRRAAALGAALGSASGRAMRFGMITRPGTESAGGGAPMIPIGTGLLTTPAGTWIAMLAARQWRG